MVKISLLHPSRGRPDRAIESSKKWISLAGCEVEYILSLDIDEPCKRQYIENGMPFIINNNRSAVDAINNAAKHSTGDILMVMSDDFDCNPDWGKAIIENTNYLQDWIAKTPDGIQPWIITAPIMDRIYYNRFGYIYYPGYIHMFCDTELTCVADLTDRKIDLPVRFQHNHYSTGRSKKDFINERADKSWSQGESLFLQRARIRFGLNDAKGTIKSKEYLSWLKSKGVSI